MMASEKKMNDSTCFQPSYALILCANSCGFFGTRAAMNPCSKCCRGHKTREEQAATAMAAVEKSMSSAPPSPRVVVVAERAVEAPTVMAVPSSSVTATRTEILASIRCGCCNKEVGVMGFKSKYGCSFCGVHGYPEKHSCSFDFKGAGRDSIAKAAFAYEI